MQRVSISDIPRHLVLAVRRRASLLTLISLSLATLVLCCYNNNSIEQFIHSSSDDNYGSPRCHVMRQRLSTLRSACRLNPSLAATPKEHQDGTFFHFNRPRRTLMCTPYKVGSESWRIFFERLDEKDRNSSEWRSSNLKYAEDAAQMLEDPSWVVRAVQARHPLERLISAYRFVFLETDMYRQDHINDKILRRYGGRNSTNDGGGYEIATFSQFVQFVIHGEKDFEKEPHLVKQGVASHWRPQVEQCNPCHRDLLDPVLLHMETSKEDSLCYLELLGEGGGGGRRKGSPDEDDKGRIIGRPQQKQRLVQANQNSGGHSSLPRVKEEYMGQLTRAEIKKLSEDVYRMDYLVHGYQMEDYVRYAKDD